MSRVVLIVKAKAWRIGVILKFGPPRNSRKAIEPFWTIRILQSQMPVVTEEQPLPVRQARAGEPGAWEVLLCRYRLPLYAYVFELVHHEQASLDIVQEAFINAARHIRGLRDDEKFGSWLFNIAHQKCIQHWRRQHHEAVPLPEQDEDLPAIEPGPLELLSAKSRKRPS